MSDTPQSELKPAGKRGMGCRRYLVLLAAVWLCMLVVWPACQFHFSVEARSSAVSVSMFTILILVCSMLASSGWVWKLGCTLLGAAIVLFTLVICGDPNYTLADYFLHAASKEEKAAYYALSDFGATAGTKNGHVGWVEFEDLEITEAELLHLRAFPELRILWMSGMNTTDATISLLSDLQDVVDRIESLGVRDSRVTDAALDHLNEFTNLKMLYLGNTQVSDVGVEHLKGLTNLEILGLGNTQVSDDGLEHLKGLTKLEELYLYDTQVSDDGVKKLQQALPNCKLFR